MYLAVYLLNTRSNNSEKGTIFLYLEINLDTFLPLPIRFQSLDPKILFLLIIENAIQTMYNSYFPEIKKLEKKEEAKPYDKITSWFIDNKSIEILDDSPDNLYKEELLKVEPLKSFVTTYNSNFNAQDLYFFMELVLWSLTIHKKLSKSRFENGSQFQDMFGDFIRGL